MLLSGAYPNLADSETCAAEAEKYSSKLPVEFEKCMAPSFFKPRPGFGQGEPPVEVAMMYELVDRTIGSESRCQVSPSIKVFTPLDNVLQEIVSGFPSEAAGHDISNVRVESISLQNGSEDLGFRDVRIDGRLTLELKLKYEYPCFYNWKMYTCDGWTRLYSYSPRWNATFSPSSFSFETAGPGDPDYSALRHRSGVLYFKPKDTLSTYSPHREAISGFLVDVPPENKNIDIDITNDLVKGVQAIVNALGYAMSASMPAIELFAPEVPRFLQRFDLEKFSEDEARDLSYSFQVNFVRDVLSERVGDFSESLHFSPSGRTESLVLSALLNSFTGKDVVAKYKTASGIGGRFLEVTYEINPNDLIERLEGVSGKLDPLKIANFCASTKATISSELSDLVMGSSEKVEIKPGDSDLSLNEVGFQLSGKHHLSLLLREMIGVEGQSRLVSRQDMMDFANGSVTARNFSDLDEMARFYEFTESEAICARNLAIATSGEADLIFPGQSFAKCMARPATLSLAQEDAIRDLESLLGGDEFWDRMKLAGGGHVVEPPMRNAQYRGWYYCYINKSSCGTDSQNVIRWDQRLSQFEGRPGNRHNGVDIFDEKHSDGKSQIFAVASAKVFYRSVSGWGHTLFLPFTKAGKSYYAVYAHLDPGAAALDGKVFSKGQLLFSTGCSGNAGNGKGLCNNYCKVGDAFRADEHLHFEVLERSSGGATTVVDPLSVFDTWAIGKPDTSAIGNKICSECKGGSCVPSAVAPL